MGFHAFNRTSLYFCTQLFQKYAPAGERGVPDGAAFLYPLIKGQGYLDQAVAALQDSPLVDEVKRAQLDLTPAEPDRAGFTALLPGEKRFVIVGDTKARADGHLTETDILTMQDYCEQHNADGAVIIAGSFADGKLRKF